MKALAKYRRVFVLGIQSSMEYRANFFLSILSTFFPMLIQFFLWSAVFTSTSNERVYGYTYMQMITYSFLAGIVSKVVATGFQSGISQEIKNGGLNKFIVQPIKFSYYKICDFLGQKVIQLLFMLVLASIILGIFNVYLGLVLELHRIILFIAALLLALMLNFVIFYSLSTLAFWTSETWGIFGSFAVVGNIASGGVFPIDIFGKTIQTILNYLPFKYVIYFPINVLNGRLDVNQVFIGMFVQICWIIIVGILAKILWKLGTKKYIAAGG